MQLVVLYGAPGVGKLTVARALAELTGYKVFHNHLTVDLVTSIFPFGSEQALRLSDRYRLEMFQEAAKANVPGLIFTFVYAAGKDDWFIQQILDVVEPFKTDVRFVLLTCDREVLLKRVAHEARARFAKLRDPRMVERLLDQEQLDKPVPHVAGLSIDTTTRPPKEAAQEIREWLARTISPRDPSSGQAPGQFLRG